MNMNKCAFLAMAIMCSGISAVNAADNLQFHGTVKAPTCELASESKAIAISWGTLTVADFAGLAADNNSRYFKKPFHLIFNNCPASATSVAITFKGDIVSTSSVYAPSNPYSMVGYIIGMKSLDGGSKAMPNQSYNYTVTPGTTDLPFNVGLGRSAGNPVSAGSLDGSITYDVTYL